MYKFVHGSLPHFVMRYIHIRPQYTHLYNIYISQIRTFTSSTTRSSSILLCKGPMIWNVILTCSQQSHSLKRVVLSFKSVVVRGYEDLAQP